MIAPSGGFTPAASSGGIGVSVLVFCRTRYAACGLNKTGDPERVALRPVDCRVAPPPVDCRVAPRPVDCRVAPRPVDCRVAAWPVDCRVALLPVESRVVQSSVEW